MCLLYLKFEKHLRNVADHLAVITVCEIEILVIFPLGMLTEISF